MLPKNLLAVLLLFLFQTKVSAQKETAGVSKELSVITENDNYNFTEHDRYYTNGLFIRYNWLQKANTQSNNVKTINRFEAGQMIYNSWFNRHSNAEVLTTLDRPYAGWLYASFGKTKFKNSNDVLLYDATVGILGPGALGKEVQTGYHKLMRLYNVYGWGFQLKNEMGVNTSLQYYHSLLNKDVQNVSLHLAGKASLGNTFTNASAGFLLKFGKLRKEAESAFWSGNLGTAGNVLTNKCESIFFLESLLTAQAYNATVQGGLFRQDKGYYVAPLHPLIYVIKGGAVFSWKQTAFSIVYTVKQREARSMIDKAEFYGAFGLSFRFR